MPPTAVPEGSPSPARGLRARAGSIRVRTTAAAMAIVGLALVGGSIVAVTVLHDRLTDGVRAAARLRADEVAASWGSSPAPGALAVEDAEDQFIQVVDGQGKVLASSSNVEGRPPVARLQPGQSTAIPAPVDQGEFLAVAAASNTPQGRLTVIVGRTLGDVSESTRVLTRMLLVGAPLLLSVVGFTTWKVVGRALAPVEAMRREVDEISATELHRRVPQPAGRDEIARLASTLNRMLGRLEDSQAKQRRFVSDASHELRSPVASIRQHAEVALAHPERASLGELAETVLAEDLRVQQLVEDLLVLARADEGPRSAGHHDVDLDDLVFEETQRVRETREPESGHPRALPEIDTTAVSGGQVRGDPAQLRRMVRNLVDNATRHARSRVGISLGEHDQVVVLGVEDDGAGIPEAERARVFERFVRLDDARARDGGGSGLGLAIVAEVVAGHGGTVSVTRAPAGGARFEVRLPRHPD